jgi:hypothetical protein
MSARGVDFTLWQTLQHYIPKHRRTGRSLETRASSRPSRLLYWVHTRARQIQSDEAS